jgi:uncharacterized protein YcbX
MDVAAGARVAEIYRYPVKGLSAQPMTEVRLTADDGVPGDRVFALALPGTEFDEDDPAALSKRNFLMLQRDELLARARTEYDPRTGLLRVGDGARSFTADLATAAGRRAVEEFFGALAAPTAGTSGAPGVPAPPGGRSTAPGATGPAGGGLPRLVEARHGHRFTDAGPDGPAFMRAISILSLASLRDLAARVGQPVDPLRFRANIYLDGLEPWVEREWAGQELTLGAARVRVLSDIGRCAAVTVNPRTAQRDLKVLHDLQTHYGHTQCGCYAQVLAAGTVRVGDLAAPVPAEASAR